MLNAEQIKTELQHREDNLSAQMLGPCFTAWSSADHVLWTCLCHWNNHLCFTALKGSFWLGVFLSDGIGKFMKLHARRRLCNRKIISLLAAVLASANEPSFPFGLRSDWSLRPCSPWMFLSLVISRCSFVPVSSLLPPGAGCSATLGEVVIAASHPLMKQGKSPALPMGPKIPAEGFSLRCQQGWPDRGWPGAEQMYRPCFLVAFVQRLILLKTEGNKA